MNTILHIRDSFYYLVDIILLERSSDFIPGLLSYIDDWFIPMVHYMAQCIVFATVIIILYHYLYFETLYESYIIFLQGGFIDKIRGFHIYMTTFFILEITILLLLIWRNYKDKKLVWGFFEGTDEDEPCPDEYADMEAGFEDDTEDDDFEDINKKDAIFDIDFWKVNLKNPICFVMEMENLKDLSYEEVKRQVKVEFDIENEYLVEDFSKTHAKIEKDADDEKLAYWTDERVKFIEKIALLITLASKYLIGAGLQISFWYLKSKYIKILDFLKTPFKKKLAKKAQKYKGKVILYYRKAFLALLKFSFWEEDQPIREEILNKEEERRAKAEERRKTKRFRKMMREFRKQKRRDEINAAFREKYHAAYMIFHEERRLHLWNRRRYWEQEDKKRKEAEQNKNT